MLPAPHWASKETKVWDSGHTFADSEPRTDAVFTRAFVMSLCPQGLCQKQSPVSSRTKDSGILRPVPLVSRRPPSNYGPKGKPHWSRPVSGCGSAWWRGEDDHSSWKVLPLLSSPHIRDDYFCSWSEKSDFHSKHCIMRTGSHKHQLHFDWIKHIIFVFRSTDYMLPAAPACLPLSSDWLSVYLRCRYLSHSLVYKLCIVYKRPPSCSLVSWEITDRNPWWQD